MLSARPHARTLGALRQERGAVLVWVVIWLPVLFLFISFVLDAGNWWEHRRHLQTQADAAALAGGTEFNYPCDAATAAEIEEVARDYGGPHNGHTASPYNAQVGGTPANKLYLLVNSTDFWNEGGTNYSDGGRPCVDTSYLDVKITEADLPFFFPFVAELVPAINARARVEIQKIGSIGGEQLLPLFVRDVKPKSGAALFVREYSDGSAPTLIDAEYMTKASTCDSGLTCWDNAGEPADVTVATAGQRTSVMIALSSYETCTATGDSPPCFDLDNTLTPQEICFQDGVECYWADDTSVRGGIVYIQGYSTAGGGAPPNSPALREVTLSSGSANPCAGGSFSFIEADCNVRLHARIDMGGFNVTNSGDVRVRAYGGNCGNQWGTACPLSDSDVDGDSTNDGVWQGDIEIDAAPNNPDTFDPRFPFSVEWRYVRTTMGGVACGNSFSNVPDACKGTFSYVQRAFSGTDPKSGPIRAAGVYNAVDATPATSLVVGTGYQLYAAIKLAGSVATDPDDPPIRLRVATNQGAVDCDPNVQQTREEITLGCSPIYTFNNRTGQDDPCTPPYEPPTQLFSYDYNQVYSPNTSPGYDCVLTTTGAQPNPIAAGMIGRVFNNRVPIEPGPAQGVNVCPNPGPGVGSNNWESNFPDFDDDPRVVVLFMVPFGAFRGTGQALYPISNFGAFYVTDWWAENPNLDDACGTDGDGPGGWISGHFINYRLPSNTTGGGGEQCDPGDFTPCVVVLTD